MFEFVVMQELRLLIIIGLVQDQKRIKLIVGEGSQSLYLHVRRS